MVPPVGVPLVVGVLVDAPEPLVGPVLTAVVPVGVGCGLVGVVVVPVPLATLLEVDAPVDVPLANLIKFSTTTANGAL
mgnify:CR=1 FL=1